MLAFCLEAAHMAERMKHLVFAALLTWMVAAALDGCFGSLWRVWSQIPWWDASLLALLALWVAPTEVPWLHVHRDFRRTWKETPHASSSAAVRAITESGKRGDV